MAQEPKVTVSKKYLQNIEKKVEDLKTLIEVSAIISSTLDYNDLISLVMEKAKKVMDAEACSLLLYNKETNKLEFEVALCKTESTSEALMEKVTLDMGQGIAGWVAENLKPLVVEDVKSDKRFYQEADKLTGFHTKSLIAAPLIGRTGLIGVAELLNSRKKGSFDSYDAEIFQTHCRQIAIAIENARFYKESIDREKLKQEFEIASAVQRSFLPESPVFQRGGMSVTAVNLSAKQVGGDIYDFVEPVDGRIGVLIGDVSGKGVSAALYMAKIISDFRYIAHSKANPEDTLKRLNAQLARAPRGMFLTCIYVIADTSSGELRISVAGHPPFVLLSGGEAKVLTVPSGPPLGIQPVDYPSAALSLREGDRLLLLTDGVFDAKNKKGERIGFEKIVDFVTGHAGEERLVQSIVDYVDDFAKGMERADDLTLVEIKYGNAQ
jgi:sigma-B regulation protein RsbU (phosphoserine phosphatase)